LLQHEQNAEYLHLMSKYRKRK